MCASAWVGICGANMRVKEEKSFRFFVVVVVVVVVLLYVVMI